MVSHRRGAEKAGMGPGGGSEGCVAEEGSRRTFLGRGTGQQSRERGGQSLLLHPGRRIVSGQCRLRSSHLEEEQLNPSI